MGNRYIKSIGAEFFNSKIDRPYGYLFWGWSICLAVSGCFLWGLFLNWGNIDFNFQDWSEITGPRLFFLQNAISQGVLPLHMPGTSALDLLTDRYLSIPDLLLSPQVLLMRFISPSQFVLWNWIILFLAGFWGLIKFSKKYQLSPFVLTLIFLLFNFNGQIEAHLSVGHNTWGGYFLFPWFVIFIFELEMDTIHWRWVVKVAALLFLIFLQGSFHQFVWLLIFLGIAIISFPKHFGAIIMSGILACLFSAVRILPSILIVQKVNQEFLGGFPGFWGLVSGLIELRDANTIVSGLIHPVYIWEFDFYIGIFGALFLAFFGVYRWVKKPIISLRLLIPIIGLVILSLGGVYELLHWTDLPLFYGERVTSRIFSVPLTFVIFLAGLHCQSWLNEPKKTPYLYGFLMIGAIFLCSDLWNHFQLWEISSLSTLFADPLHVFNPSTWIQTDYVDSLYTGYIRRGAIISGISIALALVMARVNPVEGFSIHMIHHLFVNLHLPNHKVNK
jgi:hypothetical protein